MSSLMGTDRPWRWWWTHVLLPLAVLGTAIVGLECTDLDARAMEPFYDPMKGHFPLRKFWLFKTVLHEGGKWLVLIITSALAALVLVDLVVKRWRPWRGPAAYLVVCVATTSGIVGWLKAVTNRYPPWDLDRFGGKVPFTPLFESTPEPFTSGHGFPAGHASAAFAWVALYFLARAFGIRRPVLWLAPGLLLGSSFAWVQHVRGAHFPSHNLWTLAIAWMVALSVAAIFTARGWLPSPPGAGTPDARAVVLSIAVRSWWAGIGGMIAGSTLFAIDITVDQLHLGTDHLHFWIECVEFAIVGPGLGAVCLLLVERLRISREAVARRAAEERERRFQVLGRMAAAVAHEVRNPLHTLRLVQDELCHDLPALRSHPLLSEVERSLERIDRAVELVYQLARPSADDVSVVDVAAAVREAVGSRHGRARIELTAPVGQALVHASSSGLRMVLDNLLRNAIEATPPEGLITVNLDAADGAWLLTMINPGVLPAGVASGSLGEHVDSQKSEGLGLGLAIARHLASNAGGALTLTQEGEQVRALLRLPTADGAAQP
jgi:membrane-associated PAP2 superfamily phosphatase/two-component sensor histidine kinase